MSFYLTEKLLKNMPQLNVLLHKTKLTQDVMIFEASAYLLKLYMLMLGT